MTIAIITITITMSIPITITSTSTITRKCESLFWPDCAMVLWDVVVSGFTGLQLRVLRYHDMGIYLYSN